MTAYYPPDVPLVWCVFPGADRGPWQLLGDNRSGSYYPYAVGYVDGVWFAADDRDIKPANAAGAALLAALRAERGLCATCGGDGCVDPCSGCGRVSWRAERGR